MRCLLLVAAVLCLASPAFAYVPGDALRYAPGMHLPGVEIADNPYYSISNFTRQWTYDIYIANKNVNASDFKLHRCNGTRSSSNITWQALPTWGADCNKLPDPKHPGHVTTIKQGDGWLIKLVFKRTNATGGLATFKRYHNWDMDHVVVRLDIANETAADRGWRKKNGLYPKYGQHVRFIHEYPASDLEAIMSGATFEHIFDMDEKDELPKVVMYPEVCVVCTRPQGGTDYCQCDRANVNNRPAGIAAKTFETDAVMGVTTGLEAAAIVCSVFSALLFVVYYIADHMYYNKTGKPLGFF